MWPPEPQAGSRSPDCPDLLQDVQEQPSPSTPLYLSFFEEECRAIVARLRGAAAEPSPGPGELSGLQAQPAGPSTSTPLPFPCHGWVPDSSAGDREAAAAPGPAPAPAPMERGCLPQPMAGGGPGALPAHSPALSRRARRGSRQPSGGGSGTPARSSGRGRGRLGLPRAQASLGLQLPAAGPGRGARETRLLRPPGTRLKLTSPARSRLQRASGASQKTQPSRIPTLAPRDRETKSNSAPASCVSRSREARSTTQELVCNRTRELKENDKSKERLVAASIVLGADKNDQTWVMVESSLSSELASGLTSGCEDAVPAEQSAGDQLSQELERVKKELEQVKAELADKTAQCEAYQQTISSLQAQLRPAGICLKDAAVFNSGDLRRD